MTKTATALGFILMALTSGCGDDDDGPAADGGGPDAVSGLKFSALLSDSETNLPLEGVEICVRDSTLPCAHSNATGRFDLSGIPIGSAFTLRFFKTGYYAQNHMYGPQTRDVSTVLLLNSRTYFNAQASVLGVAFDAAKGHASAQVGPMGSGATFTLSPASGSGPYYTANGSLLFEPSRTSASDTGVVGFVNVAPGNYTITATLVGKTCSANAPGTAANTASITVFAGEASVNDYKCQ